MKCLFCPDSSVPNYSRFLTQITDSHHIQGRRTSDYTIPVCRYHHSLIHDGHISKAEIVQKANEYYGEEKFYIPYPGSKKIKVYERA